MNKIKPYFFSMNVQNVTVTVRNVTMLRQAVREQEKRGNISARTERGVTYSKSVKIWVQICHIWHVSLGKGRKELGRWGQRGGRAGRVIQAFRPVGGLKFESHPMHPPSPTFLFTVLLFYFNNSRIPTVPWTLLQIKEFFSDLLRYDHQINSTQT